MLDVGHPLKLKKKKFLFFIIIFLFLILIAAHAGRKYNKLSMNNNIDYIWAKNSQKSGSEQDNESPN